MAVPYGPTAVPAAEYGSTAHISRVAWLWRGFRDDLTFSMLYRGMDGGILY